MWDGGVTISPTQILNVLVEPKPRPKAHKSKTTQVDNTTRSALIPYVKPGRPLALSTSLDTNQLAQNA